MQASFIVQGLGSGLLDLRPTELPQPGQLALPGQVAVLGPRLCQRLPVLGPNFGQVCAFQNGQCLSRLHKIAWLHQQPHHLAGHLGGDLGDLVSARLNGTADAQPVLDGAQSNGFDLDFGQVHRFLGDL